ncbi:hypothetical protein OG21DRAFT_1391305, partial [Imleria badia]
RLPRPAQLYSTPSMPPLPHLPSSRTPSGDFSFYNTKGPPDSITSGEGGISFVNDMHGFLHRRVPTPLPDQSHSTPLSTYFFLDSPTQDQLVVMDACLYNLYDLPRAKQIFERLRKS